MKDLKKDKEYIQQNQMREKKYQNSKYIPIMILKQDKSYFIQVLIRVKIII